MDHEQAEELSLKHVFNAIKGVIQWYQLGVQLNVNSCRLDIIKANHPNDVEGAKMGLVTEWLNNDPDKSWDKLASALRQMGHINLSDKISAYGQDVVFSQSRNHPQSPKKSATSLSSHPQSEISSFSGAESASTKAATALECIHDKSDHKSSTRSPILSRRARVIVYELESQFGELVKGMKEDLQFNEEKISELRDIIEYKLPQRIKGIRKYISLESITVENFSNFFKDLECLWDFLDFDLLRCMIILYKNKELNSKLERYEKNIEKFCAETTIQELIENWMPRFDEDEIPEKLKLCVTELSWDPNTRKVKDLKRIQKKLKESLPQELAMAAFYICEVNCSSVKIVWLVWTNVVSQIKEKMRKLFQDNPDFITENQISCFTLDKDILYSCYYDKKTQKRQVRRQVRRQFGDFECVCSREWKSANCWRKVWQKCNRCHRQVYPINLRPLLYQGGEVGKPHEMENCGMCQRLGYNCKNYTALVTEAGDGDSDDDDDDDDDVSVYSEASSISSLSEDDRQLKDEDVTPVQSDDDETDERLDKALGKMRLRD